MNPTIQFAIVFLGGMATQAFWSGILIRSQLVDGIEATAAQQLIASILYSILAISLYLCYQKAKNS